MLVAAAFCPAPPLLHPAVAAGAAPEAAELRRDCLTVVRSLLDANPDVVVTLGVAPRTGPYPVGARGSMRGVGADVVLGTGNGPVELPRPLALAAWLLDDAGSPVDAAAAVDPTIVAFGVTADEDPARCADLGAGLADRGARVALLVMGDSSACRDAKAPGSFDERAEGFDGVLATALGAADLDTLADLDTVLAADLMVEGRAPWQVAAGSARARAATGEPALSGRLLRHEAPYGVGYLVASWTAGG